VLTAKPDKKGALIDLKNPLDSVVNLTRQKIHNIPFNDPAFTAAQFFVILWLRLAIFVESNLKINDDFSNQRLHC